MKHSPILQLIKMIVGVGGFAYFGYQTILCYDPYVAWRFLFATLFFSVIAMHGWLKFRGDEN